MTDRKKANIKTIPLDLLDEIPDNTNEMDEGEFNLLCEGIKEGGRCPPLIVAPSPHDKKRYVIMDGNHRKRAVALLGWTEVECDVWDDVTDADVQKIISARVNIVRGKPNKDNMTKLWLRVRERAGDDRSAMRILGIKNERTFAQVVHGRNRKADSATVAADHVQRAIGRARQVEDMAMVIRAIIGDGAGNAEYDYLVFQVRGSNIVLIRVDKEEYEDLRQYTARVRDAGVSIGTAVKDGLALILGDDGFSSNGN